MTPSATVSIYGEEGLESALVFGNKTLDQSAYYVQLAGKPEVYLVAKAVANPFFFTPTQYLKKDIFESYLEDVSALTIQHPRFGTIQVVRTADAAEEGLLGTWTMTAPYQKAMRGQETEDWIKSILSIIGTDLIESTQQAAEYGLTTPDATVTITAKNGRTETIRLSTEKAALLKQGRDRIYLLSDTADAFLDTDPFSLLEPFLTKIDVASLETFAWADHVVRLGDVYTLDGKKLDANAFKNAYLELMMVTIMAPAQTGDATALAKPPVFEYRFKGKDGSITTVTMHEITPQTYLAKVNGRADYRVDAYKVKTARDALNALSEE